jgi:hypothetical protein
MMAEMGAVSAETLQLSSDRRSRAVIGRCDDELYSERERERERDFQLSSYAERNAVVSRQARVFRTPDW